MARAALGWSANDLAVAAGVGYATVARFESGQTIAPQTLDLMRSAIEREGVTLIDSGKFSGGVVPPRKPA